MLEINNQFNHRESSLRMDHHKQTYKLTDCSSQANHPLAHQHETHEIAHTDPFGKDLMKPMDEFSHKHKDMHHRGVEGTYISHTTFSSTVVGPDGKAHKEMYMEDSAGLHKGGQTISQTQQMYKNTEGVNKIAEERMLNEQGRKIVKSKEGEEVHETEHYHNVEPEHKEEFDKKWEGMDKETKFVENSQKEMKKLGAHGHGQKAIQTNEHPNKCQKDCHKVPACENKQCEKKECCAKDCSSKESTKECTSQECAAKERTKQGPQKCQQKH